VPVSGSKFKCDTFGRRFSFAFISVEFSMRLCLAIPCIVGAALAANGPVPLDELTEQESTRKRADYQAYALRHQGDAQRGRSVFENESKAACIKCHSTSGSLARSGPDLSCVGDKFQRRQLIEAVLQPSSRIAIGYGTSIVQTNDGKTHVGVLHRVTDEWIELLDQNSIQIRIAAADVVEQETSSLSLMPDGLENTMTRRDFADLTAYLETLKQPPPSESTSLQARNEIPACASSVALVPFFDEHVRFDHPVWFAQVPATDNRFVVLEHFGKSWLVEKLADGDRQTPFLDLSGLVRPGGATGLLGMAFHPKFRENRKYYLKYQIVEDGRISTIVEQRWFAQDGRGDSGRAPQRLFKIPSATQDHNGGCLEFGPDGYLYIGMGDTGPQGDPHEHGQDLTTLLGKILRVDVDQPDSGQPYGTPPDNPFRRTPGARPEIWAYGFREPWRFSFDFETADLWVGDVGQDRFEEIAIVRAGENHGWNVYEGLSPFSDRFRTAHADYIEPVASYSRRLGFSVTGGYVYRGRQAPSVIGRYIFGDFESRRIWALRHNDHTPAEIVEIGRSPSRIVSFAQDDRGELYLVGYDSSTIYHLDLQGVDLTPLKARAIAETSEIAPVPWRFTLTAPPRGWAAVNFDDSSWAVGPGGFGTTGTPGAVVRTDWRTSDIWLRREFNLPARAVRLQKVALRLHHDEDAEVYLNGVEVGRVTRWTTGYGDVPLNRAGIAALRSGRNVLAIHCRQQNGGQYIDAGLVEYFTMN
jgi:putative heme-binding domain-containing protein